MQLIFEPESATHVNAKMTSITSEFFDDKLKSINGFKDNSDEVGIENGTMEATKPQKLLDNGKENSTGLECETENAVKTSPQVSESLSKETTLEKKECVNENTESIVTSTNEEKQVSCDEKSSVTKLSVTIEETDEETNTEILNTLNAIKSTNSLLMDTDENIDIQADENNIISDGADSAKSERSLKEDDDAFEKNSSVNAEIMEVDSEYPNLENKPIAENESEITEISCNKSNQLNNVDAAILVIEEKSTDRSEDSISKDVNEPEVNIDIHKTTGTEENNVHKQESEDNIIDDKDIKPIDAADNEQQGATCTDTREEKSNEITETDTDLPENCIPLTEHESADVNMSAEKIEDNVEEPVEEKDSNEIIKDKDGSSTEKTEVCISITNIDKSPSLKLSDDITIENSAPHTENTVCDKNNSEEVIEHNLEKIDTDSNDTVREESIANNDIDLKGDSEIVENKIMECATNTEKDIEMNNSSGEEIKSSLDTDKIIAVEPVSCSINNDELDTSENVCEMNVTTDTKPTDHIANYDAQNQDECIKDQINTNSMDVDSNCKEIMDVDTIRNIDGKVIEGDVKEVNNSCTMDTDSDLNNTDSENIRKIDQKTMETENITFSDGQIDAETPESLAANGVTTLVEDTSNKTNKDLISPNDSSVISQETQLVTTSQPHKKYSLLSNTLDILSDDEDEPPKEETLTETNNKTELVNDKSAKQFINIDDDDDIMLIDDDPAPKTDTPKEKPEHTQNIEDIKEKEPSTYVEDKPALIQEEINNKVVVVEKQETLPENPDEPVTSPTIGKEKEELSEIKHETPLLPTNFLKAYKNNIADMTREDLEEFCLLKIVEGIVDRSSLSEIKSKLKTMAQNYEDCKKKVIMVTKQNRDLQVVLKSVQEEQKKSDGTSPITPLKITRSVGMQIVMQEKSTMNMRRRMMTMQPQKQTPPSPQPQQTPPCILASRNGRQKIQTPSPVKPTNIQQIPVPRLVPANANNSILRNAITTPGIPPVRLPITVQNGVKNLPPNPKLPEKRPRPEKSFTVDLTDDEPPPKQLVKNSPVPPVRLVSTQNLLAPRPPGAMVQQVNNSPRKIFIPPNTSGIMVRTVNPPAAQRPRLNTPMVRIPSGTRVNRMANPNRHPAPLPLAMKQYQPLTWKALPPAPDLKLSKVENGIVISWKIDGYQEDSYEEIASYQLYAYQETCLPPSTNLWKKIGDVKALPLPMACTLTQFMAGYKYYFAVRAVDIRSRLGPFSLPGSILLLNK